MRTIAYSAGITFLAGSLLTSSAYAQQASDGWRSIPLIQNGKVADDWAHIGFGSFVVDEGSLRTECDGRGMGLLLYKKEKLGNCQLRIVYRSKDAKSNSGVYVRIDDGILDWVSKESTPVQRDVNGKLPKDQLEKLMDLAEREQGVWYPVHHGYEVQIMDSADEGHRTGAIYSLTKAAPLPKKSPGEWRTMVITLKGNLVLVDVDGERVSTFDPAKVDTKAERKWTEPKREPQRPEVGYFGLQNHDPADVVYFKEISIRALPPQ